MNTQLQTPFCQTNDRVSYQGRDWTVLFVTSRFLDCVSVDGIRQTLPICPAVLLLD